MGWGNRIRGFVGILALAMLSRRVLLVNWTEPCPIELLLKPALLDWRMRESDFDVALKDGEKLCMRQIP